MAEIAVTGVHCTDFSIDDRCKKTFSKLKVKAIKVKVTQKANCYFLKFRLAI